METRWSLSPNSKPNKKQNHSVAGIANANLSGPFQVASSVYTFDRSGRITQEEHYTKGVPGGRTTYEYGSNGLMSKLIETGADGKRDEHDYDDSVPAAAVMARHHAYSVSSMLGDLVVKYDSRGNVVERVDKEQSTIASYDSDDRDIETKVFHGGQLDFSVHSTYEDDAYGNWTKREVSLWLAEFPQFGYRLQTVNRRRIAYFEEQ